MCIDVNLPWTIWRFLLSHPSEPKGNSWGLAIVNPIFQRRFPVSRFFIRPALLDVCVWNNCMDVKLPWAIWRFLLSRPSEPNSDPSCLAVVNPTHMQGDIYLVQRNFASEREASTGHRCLLACLYYDAVCLYVKGSCGLYIFTLLVHVPKTPAIYN